MTTMNEFNKIISKVKERKELTEKEIEYLVDYGKFVDEIEGNDHRWQKEVQTIIDIDGELYAIDWMRGLTECQENEYDEQPYKVKRMEKKIVKIEYVALESEEEQDNE